MTILIKNPRSLFISLVIIATTSIFSVGANAGLFYNGYAEIGFDLVNVARTGGSGNGNGTGSGPGVGDGPSKDDYAVTLSGSIFESDTSTSGAGVANVETNLFIPGDLLVDDPNYQDSRSYGNSSGSSNDTGEASSYAEADFSIIFENLHQNPLSFELSIFSFISAEVGNDGPPLIFGDDADAFAEILLFGNGIEIFSSSVEAFIGGSMMSSENAQKSMIFEVVSGTPYEISGSVYSDGYAVKALDVPEPSMVWLMALGLIFMLVKNYHVPNKVNTYIGHKNY